LDISNRKRVIKELKVQNSLQTLKVTLKVKVLTNIFDAPFVVYECPIVRYAVSPTGKQYRQGALVIDLCPITLSS